MIIKIQLSAMANAPGYQVLIHDESKKFRFKGNAPQEIVDLMNGRLKAYFKARIIDIKLDIEEEAKLQRW